MEPLIITAALVGGELSRKDTPYLPLTPREIGSESVEVVRQGASIVHLHARDRKGVPKHEPAIFAEIMQEVRDQCHAAHLEVPIIQFSTGGSIGMTLEDRVAPLRLKPDMASLTTGSVNFGEAIFENSHPMMTRIAQTAKGEGVAIELEIFDAGMIDNAMRLLREGILEEPLRFNFVLGVPGGLSGEAENLVYLRRRIPERAIWSVAGIGRWQLPLAAQSIAMGGHVRVGLEDNIFFRKGELAKGNAPLVARIVRIARELGREPASVTAVREILQLGGKNMKKNKQRKHPRVPMMVHVKDSETGEEKQYFSREVSVGGIFLETDYPYEIGKVLQLSFAVPGSANTFQVGAKVVHVGAKGEGKVAGFGLHFQGLPAAAEREISAYVERLELIRRKLTQEK